ncbi:uncharacterized protein LOC135691751 isoform X1 [Rhopilema esculentum]|uniref:uncharacterized protein LOC135691751 isoform X1 n=1 Tax=Rhopilema esculentum TaxID=499914 RepID=UPI0031D82659
MLVFFMLPQIPPKMPDEIENEVVTQIQPIFPQFDEHVIRMAITHVRQRVQTAQGGQPLTTALLLPACIDFLLEVTQDFILPLGNNLQVNGISRPLVPVSEEGKTNNGVPAVIIIDSQEDADKTLITADTKMSVTKSNNKDKYEPTVYAGIERPAFDSTVTNPWNTIRSSDSSSSSSSSGGSESSDSHLPSSSSYDSETFTNSSLNTNENCEENRRKSDQQLNTHKEVLKSALEIVVGVVPNVDEKFAMDYLKRSAQCTNYDQARMANELIEHLFENHNYPKKVEVVKDVKDNLKKEKVTSDVDYYKVEGLQTSLKQLSLYKQQCMVLLANKFTLIPYKFLKKAFYENFQRYARTYKHLQEMLDSPAYGTVYYFKFLFTCNIF